MEHRFENVSYNGIKCSVILATKLFLSFFVLLSFGGSLIVGNKDILFCHKLWNDLGSDMADWRERCLDGDQEINSTRCQAEKEYFDERRRSHRQMCFYEGPFPEPYLLAVSERKIAVVDLTSNYSTVVIDERHNIKNLIIDPVERNMYFKSGTKLYRANFDGSDKEVIYQDEESAIGVFSLDWIGQRMFWVNSMEKVSIVVGNVKFSNGIHVHVSENKIASLAVDPNAGYVFYKNAGPTLTRISFMGEDLKKFNMKDGRSRIFLDHANKELYYYRKSNTKKHICFLDYDGVLWKNFSFAGENVGALTFFGDFLYLQKLHPRIVQEMNVSNGVVFRNISLPKPFARLNDLVIMEQSQYPTDGCPISPCGVNQYCSNMSGSLSCKCHVGFHGSFCEGSLSESTILRNEAAKFDNKLAEWLPKTGKWKICWQATVHGWASRTFHNKCDGKIPTLTVVKVVKNNKNLIFGGYATKTWAGYHSWTHAPGSFLFSLRNNDDLAPFKAPLKDENDAHERAIYRYGGEGPVFGGGNDLRIANNAGSNNDSFTSFGRAYQLPPGYTYGQYKTDSLLAGSFLFSPSEVEVLYLNSHHTYTIR